MVKELTTMQNLNERLDNTSDAIFEREFLPQIDALYNFAYNLTRNETDAGDLVQETYLKAYKFIESYRENTNAKAWLFRILKNTFINDYRKRKNRPTQVDYEESVLFHQENDSPFSGSLDLQEDMFSAMLGDEVTLAMESLKVDFRIVILLSDIEGFSYEEIAEIINVPIGTVRSRLFRARNMLKEKLQAYAAAKYGIADKRN